MPLDFALVSDLHLEASNASLELGHARLLAACGDIYAPSSHMKKGYTHPAVDWLANKVRDRPVLFVPGNHDYEGNRVFDALSIMRETAKGTNVHVLWNDTVEIDGVRFLGTPLFTNFSFQGRISREKMRGPILGTDMRRSFNQRGRPLTGVWMARQHAIARKFLAQELDRDPAVPKVVLTHWCPTPAGADDRFAGEDHNGYWISPCEDLAAKANVWCHGHIHETVDVRVGSDPNKGWIVSNPRGYSKVFNLYTNRAFVQPRIISVGN